MARLITSGLDVGSVNSAELINAPDGQAQTTTGITFDNTTARLGKGGCFTFVLNSATETDIVFTYAASGDTLFARGYVRINGIEDIGRVIPLLSLGPLSFRYEATSNNWFSVVAPSALTTPTFHPTVGQWYKIEMRLKIGVGATDAADVYIDDLLFATATNIDTGIDVLPTTFKLGAPTGLGSSPGANSFSVDDVAVNDNSGSVQNSWCGQGKIVLLTPTGDSAKGTGWTDDNASTTSLFPSVDNIPPTGIADTTVGGGGHQIRNATSNANVNYDTILKKYADLGIGAQDQVVVVLPIIATGAPVVTSTKSGTVGMVSNPPIVNVALSSPGVAGAFWQGVAAGTYPVGWKWSYGTTTYNPSVSVNTAPVMRVTQVTSSTRIAMVAFMGLYVEYSPSEVPTLPPATPILIRLAKGMGGKLRRLHNNILIPDFQAVVSGNAYLDSTTISTVTSIVNVDVSNFVESAIISTVTALPDLAPVVITGLVPSGNGTSGTSAAPLNTPEIAVSAGIARVNGIQSAFGQIPDNTFVLSDHSDATFDRIDIVVAQQNSGAPFGPPPEWDTLALSGTPSASPVQPPTPSNCVLLATVYVPANATDSSQCTITDVRVFASFGAEDTTDYIENATITSTTTVISSEIYLTSVDAPHISPLLITLGERIRLFKLLNDNILGESPQTSIDYIDSATITSVTAVAYTESTDFVESATVSSVTTVTATELYVPFIQHSSIQPLLIGLVRAKGLKLLHNNILNPAIPLVNVDYSDNATVSGVTSVQSSESTDFLDTAGAITGTSSITFTENAQYVENATVATVTAISYTESTDYVEATTVPSVTGLTSVELYVPFIQHPSIQPLLISLTRIDGLRLLHNNILNPDTAAVGIDYIDSVTVSGVTSVQSSESVDFVDTSGAINGTSSVTFTEVAAYVDSATVSGVSTPSATDVAAYVDASTLSGVTSLTYTENAQYVESATIATVTSLSAVETTDFVENATVASVTTLTSVDLYFTATHTPQPLLITLRRGKLRLLFNNILNPADSVRVNYVESATITSITSVSAVETTDYVESATLSTVAAVTSTENGAYTDATTPSTVTVISTSDVASYVDASTASTVTSVTFTESADYVDNSTASGITIPSSSDVAAYVDANTASGTTTPSANESTDVSESNTLSTTTSLTYTEVAAYSDTATLAGVTSITYTETADFVDTATVAGVTTITYQETTQQVTSPPQPLLIRLSRHSGKLHLLRDHTQLGASRQLVTYVESATISSVTSVTYIENAQYVEVVTTSGTTSCSSTDTTDYADSNTPKGTTTPSATDVVIDLDSAIISSTSTPSSTDVANYVDSATTPSTTTPQTVENFDRNDAASITSTTTITFTESANYVDSLQPSTATSLFSTDTAQYVDGGVGATITYVSAVEQYVPSGIVSFTDFATVTSKTTLTPEYEYGPIKAFFFVGVAVRRWVMTSNYSRWEATTSRRWNSIITKLGSLQGVVSKRWRI